MRSLALAGLALVLVLSAALFWLSSPDAAAPEPSDASAPAVAALELDPPGEQGDPESPPGAAGRSAVEALSTAPAAASERAAEVRVIGRITGPTGEPFDGLTVRLSALDAWLVDEPEAAPEAVESAADGRFELRAPAPDANFVFLNGSAGPFYSRAYAEFGDRRTTAPALAPGTHDLGDLVLEPRGGLRGRVIDSEGSPIPEASLRVEPLTVASVWAVTSSGADGTFEMGAVPGGSFSVTGTAQGFVNGRVGTFEVRTGEFTEGVELVLERAPTISGRVVDGTGAGIAGARVNGRRELLGARSRTTTDEGGAFVMPLRDSGRHRLEAEAEGYRAPAGGHPLDWVEPAAEGLVLVLRRARTTRFVVLDADSRAPIERFGLSIEVASVGMTSMTPPQRPALGSYPDGEVELVAQPGADSFLAYADGYKLISAPVQWDAGSPGVQTVLLERGAVLTGQVVAGSAGRLELQRGALVKLAAWEGSFIWKGRVSGYQGEHRPGPRGPDEAGAFKQENFSRTLIVELDAEGGFEVEGLEAGGYRLFGTFGDEGFVVVNDIHLAPNESRDLARLRPAAAGVIEGRVLTPPGIESAGLTVFLGTDQESRTAALAEAGTFRFEGLEPGWHRLRCESPAGELAAAPPQFEELGPGELAQVTIDMRELSTVTLHVTVNRDGRPVEGLGVDLDFDGREPRGVTYGSWAKTDAMGKASGLVVPGTRARVRVGVGGRMLYPPGGSVQLEPGSDAFVEVDVSLGTAEVVLPADGLPERPWQAVVEFFEGSEPGNEHVTQVSAQLTEQGPRYVSSGMTVLEGPLRFRVIGLPLVTGSYRMRLMDPTKIGGEPVLELEGKVDPQP